MRILAVVPHYFGLSHPANNMSGIGSYIEPLGRIAGLSELIVGLHRHFGPLRHQLDGIEIPFDAGLPAREIDVVILATRGHELLDYLGLAPGTFEVQYIDCEPPFLPFQAQRIFRERAGSYDFYCFMEDDLIIHDPAFFGKLKWFQHSFGYKALLQAVRYELPATGTVAKILADPELAPVHYAPFRRPGQAEELTGVWNGSTQIFRLPTNPHSGSFFLSEEQIRYWMTQPSFGDNDASWIGPMESAGTYSIGRVFDIYKPLRPDPFFLAVQHFGTRYSSGSPPAGRRYGEPPLLCIAQNAMRAAIEAQRVNSDRDAPLDFSDHVIAGLAKSWLEQGTAVELRAKLDHAESELVRAKRFTTLRLAAQAKAFESQLDEKQRLIDELAASLATPVESPPIVSGNVRRVGRPPS